MSGHTNWRDLWWRTQASKKCLCGTECAALAFGFALKEDFERNRAILIAVQKQENFEKFANKITSSPVSFGHLWMGPPTREQVQALNEYYESITAPQLPRKRLTIPEGKYKAKIMVPPDDVHHPSHYTRGKIEVIDFIEDQQLGYHLGQVIKYVSRAGHKDPKTYMQDLEKARWYLDREIRRVSGQGSDPRPITADM